MNKYKVKFSGEAYVDAETPEEAQVLFDKGFFQQQRLYHESVEKVDKVEENKYISIEAQNVFGLSRNMSLEQLVEFLGDLFDTVSFADEIFCESGLCEDKGPEGCPFAECIYGHLETYKEILSMNPEIFKNERERVNMIIKWLETGR